MTPTPQFRLTIQTTEASLYFETMPPMPVPRVGEDVFVGGDGLGWWRVVNVAWSTPSMGAMTPTMEAILTVEWSPTNTRPAPTYDEDFGWVRAPAEPSDDAARQRADTTEGDGRG